MDSYEEILNRMIENYEFYSGSTISDESDIMLRLKVLSAEIYNNYVAQEFVKRQMFISTATGEYLDKHAQQRGLIRKEAVKATGEVTFSVVDASESDIVIKKGTVVATVGPVAKSYETVEDATLLAGQKSVKVKVVAVQGGSDYNVSENTVTVMVTPPLNISAVVNKSAFKGGFDKETDEVLRKRVLASYQDISNSTNAVYYKRLALSVDGIHSASVVPCSRGAGTVDVYVCGYNGESVTRAQIEQAQALIDENRELNVDVFVLYALKNDVLFSFTLEVFDGYDFNELSALLKEKITDYVNSLSVGEPVLLSNVGDIIHHTQGVKNYSFIDAYCSDVYPKPNEKCVVNKIDIRAVQ